MGDELRDMKHKLECLWTKYEHEPAIRSKLINHVQNQVPALLDAAHRNILDKKTRKLKYADLCQEFADEFLENTQYFHLPACGEFVKYDNVDYALISEDDLYYEILTALNKRSEYSEYKQKMKTHAVKRIRDRSITNSIPESHTIQTMLALLVPTVFPSKSEAKYFLTILGDNIMKKNEHTVHIINGNIKPFFSQLGEVLTAYLGSASGLSSFKYKYHDQDYSRTRLLRTSAHISGNAVWAANLPRNVLNTVAVACHYSSRHENSDAFVSKSIRDHNIRDYVFYLKDNTAKTIVADFVRDMLSIKSESSHHSKISTKNMLYLWKLYLERRNLPSIMFINTFKSVLKDEITFCEDADAFVDVTSKHLPFVSHFLQFWGSNIDVCPEDGQEYEVDEIAQLFKRFCEDIAVNVSITDEGILNAIQHFSPNVTVTGDKYVENISCRQWDKRKDIDTYLERFRKACEASNEVKTQAFGAIYRGYCRDAPKNSLVASKHFFENHLALVAGGHIVNAKCIKPSWWS